MLVRPVLLVVFVLLLLANDISARAELVEIERALVPVVEDCASVLSGKTAVVAARNVGKSAWPWAVHEAFASELTAALNSKGIDAVSAASDVRIEKLTDSRVEFAAADVNRIKTTGRELLVTVSISTASPAKAKIAAWNVETAAMFWDKKYDVPDAALDLNANVPELNRKMVEFCRANFDKKVGSGICAQLATVGLENIGTMIAYRPWKGSSPLPPISPKRRGEPTLVKHGLSIDLLRSVSPRLDAVKGIWFIEEGTLRPNRDDAARLQVPVNPPERYTLRLKVKRLFGNDQFAVGLIVGGRQTMASLDAYGGTVSGLHLVDGKTVKNNPTTHKGAVLSENKLVNVKIRVAPDAVSVEAEGKKIVDWNGDAQRLGQDEKFAVPRTDWLYLASWNSQFAVSDFWLDNDSAKSSPK